MCIAHFATSPYLAYNTKLSHKRDTFKEKVQLEALNQSISALTAATSQQQDSEPTAPEESLKEIAPAPAVQPSAEQTTPEASSTPADMQNMLAVLLSQLMKTQEPAGNLEESNSDKNSGPQGPRRTPTMPQEEAAGKQTGHESH